MNLYDQLKQLTDLPHGWTSYEEAVALASSVIALRPAVSVEIGVYAAKGLTALALAHKMINHGKAIGIDPYSAEASVEGQIREDYKKWWGDVDYQFIFETAHSTLQQFDVQNYAEIIKAKSRDVIVPKDIGVLRIDGNHGEEVLNDVRLYTPSCVTGAILFLDDTGWPGLSVDRAAEELGKNGWRKLYMIGNGVCYQKVKRKYEKATQ